MYILKITSKRNIWLNEVQNLRTNMNDVTMTFYIF
jgi:hypothetical protein